MGQAQIVRIFPKPGQAVVLVGPGKYQSSWGDSNSDADMLDKEKVWRRPVRKRSVQGKNQPLSGDHRWSIRLFSNLQMQTHAKEQLAHARERRQTEGRNVVDKGEGDWREGEKSNDRSQRNNSTHTQESRCPCAQHPNPSTVHLGDPTRRLQPSAEEPPSLRARGGGRKFWHRG